VQWMEVRGQLHSPVGLPSDTLWQSPRYLLH
jgi:Casein kinase II, beta subunit